MGKSQSEMIGIVVAGFVIFLVRILVVHWLWNRLLVGDGSIVGYSMPSIDWWTTVLLVWFAVALTGTGTKS